MTGAPRRVVGGGRETVTDRLGGEEDSSVMMVRGLVSLLLAL